MLSSAQKIIAKMGGKNTNDTPPSELGLPTIHTDIDYTEYETKMDDAYKNNHDLFI